MLDTVKMFGVSMKSLEVNYNNVWIYNKYTIFCLTCIFNDVSHTIILHSSANYNQTVGSLGQKNDFLKSHYMCPFHSSIAKYVCDLLWLFVAVVLFWNMVLKVLEQVRSFIYLQNILSYCNVSMSVSWILTCLLFWDPLQTLNVGLLICIYHPQRDIDKTKKTSVFKNVSFLDFCFENACN